MWFVLVFLTGSVLDAATTPRDGVIEGVVVRAADHTPVSGAEVVLRARLTANCCRWPKPPPMPREDSASSGFRRMALPCICRAPIAAAFIIPARACG